MTIRHLKIFVTVAECGKMRLAAERLFISQPSVSQAIKELETYYGIQLFDRLSQKIYLTESGERLLKYARYIVSTFDEMETEMKYAGESSLLRIGASVSVGTILLSEWLSVLEKENLNIRTRAIVSNTAIIEEKILKSELDIAVVEGGVVSEDVIQIPVLKDELVCVVGKNHPFFDKNEITLDELQGVMLISREDGSLERNQFEQILKEKHITMIIKWSCTSTEAIKNAVIHGQGVTIISYMLIQRELKEKSLKVIPIKGISLTRELRLIYHKNKFMSDAMKQFMQICSNS